MCASIEDDRILCVANLSRSLAQAVEPNLVEVGGGAW